MSTMREVAKLAGVSTSTVSHYLNKTKPVGVELQGRIESAMAELAYRQPHTLAASLRSGQTGSIGVVMDDVAGYRHNPVLKGIAATLNREGYTLMLRNSSGDPDREADHTHQLVAHQVDGIIINSAGSAHGSLDHLQSYGIPYVLMADAPRAFCPDAAGDRAGLVMQSLAEGSRAAVEYILAQGHRRVGLIAADLDGLGNAQLVAGYTGALHDAGLPLDDDLICRAAATHEGGRHALFRLIRGRNAPTAIFVTDSRLLTGVLNAIFDAALRCPAEISLVALGYLDWADAVEPPLTVLTGDGLALGRESAALLLRLINGPVAPAERYVNLPMQLIARGSVGRVCER
jgi:DNA-binding LacI/PurR family transcriptional regulator